MANADARLFAVIPAAGTGSRFGATPKQYASLGSSTVLEHSAAALLALPALQHLIIAIHPDDNQAASLPLLQDARVAFTVGGAERADSVLAALDLLSTQARADDWVLVHDAARPCLNQHSLIKLIAELQHEAVGGLLAVPAIDTLKQVVGGVIEKTVDRSAIWQAQTPQMFRFGVLHRALQCAQQEHRTVTDEASALELQGCAVKIVAGVRSNIKITFPEDLALAAFYLKQEECA